MAVPHHFLPYRNVSPYNYCGNNPLVLKDPTGFGWAGEGKLKKAFKDAVKGAKDIGLGIFDAVASDVTGQDVRTGDQNSTLYKSAKLTTHAADAYLGTSLASGGTVAEFVGVVAAPETGGTSLVLTGGGAVATAGGLWITGNALQHGAIMLSQASQSGGNSDLYSRMSKEELTKSKKSYEKLIDEHKQKLKDYKADPDKYDNQGLLQGKSPEIRKKIIEGRIRALEGQIKKQEGELKKINEALQKI